jgi:hypothetical protein
MRTVAGPYSEELDSELHGGLLLKRLNSSWPAEGLLEGKGSRNGTGVSNLVWLNRHAVTDVE